jgi:hypothetical protein
LLVVVELLPDDDGGDVVPMIRSTKAIPASSEFDRVDDCFLWKIVDEVFVVIEVDGIDIDDDPNDTSLRTTNDSCWGIRNKPSPLLLLLLL